MKKIILIILTLTSLSSFAYSANYQLECSDQSALFHSPTNAFVKQFKTIEIPSLIIDHTNSKLVVETDRTKVLIERFEDQMTLAIYNKGALGSLKLRGSASYMLMEGNTIDVNLQNLSDKFYTSFPCIIREVN
jgi:hypothetical protein